VSAPPDLTRSPGRLQDAVAAVLAEPELLEQICGGRPPRVIAKLQRFRLTPGDMAALAAIDMGSLRRFRYGLQLKRLGMARSLMPVTAGVVLARSSLDSVADRFWAGCPPVQGNAPVEHFRESAVNDFLDFVRRLPEAERPDWLLDLARYEAMRALLRCRAPSHGCHMPANDRTGSPGLLDVVVSLAHGVALDSFGYDVVTLLPGLDQGRDWPDDIRPRLCTVVARRPVGSAVQAWRLGPLAFRVLRACESEQRVNDLVGLVAATGADAGLPADAARDRVIALIRRALSVQVLCAGAAAVSERP
jgi:hypothetical protein